MIKNSFLKENVEVSAKNSEGTLNKGFSSMSFSKKTAESFSGSDGGVLIETRIPQGARAFCVVSVGTFGASEGLACHQIQRQFACRLS